MPISSVFAVELDGRPLPPEVEALLAAAHVDDSLHLPDVFVLRFRDPARTVIANTGVKIGTPVKISAFGPGEPAAHHLITGEVTALEAEFDSGGTFTVIRGYDPAHRLFRGRRTETYTQMTAADVATKVARRAQLPIGSIEPTATVFDHLSQAGQTDWEFVSGLAREVGYESAVVDGRFHFRKPRPAAEAPSAGSGPSQDPLVLLFGTDLLRFRAIVTSAEQVKEVQVRGWDVAQKRALVATEAAATVSAKLPTVTPADMAKAFGDPVYIASEVPFRAQSEVDAAAKAVAEQIAGAFAQFEGVARGNPKLQAGAAIAVGNLGPPFDGQYTITTSRHRYEPTTGYTTAFSVTGRQERSLLGLASGGAAARTMPGIVVGQISDAKDPQNQGRVTLTFPWLSETYVSDWARTVQPGAGKDRGAMVVPEVGDEVLVAFEQGDIRRPYVLGGLYNGVDLPPAGGVEVIDGNSGAVNRRSVVSRRGHRIDLLDQDGRAEGVSLATSDGQLKLTLDAVTTTITVHSDGKVTVAGAQGVVVDAGSAKLELKGGEIELAATAGLKVSAGTELSMRGATAKLDGGSMCTVQGALVKIN